MPLFTYGPLHSRSKDRRTDGAQLLGLSSFAYSFWWLEANPNPINDAYGWHFQHLTILGLCLATLTFILGLLADLTLSTRLFRFKNILSVTSAPMEVLISVLYWGLKGVQSISLIPAQQNSDCVSGRRASSPAGLGTQDSSRNRHLLPRRAFNSTHPRLALLLSTIHRFSAPSIWH